MMMQLRTIKRDDLDKWDNNASTWKALPANWSGTTLDMLRLDVGDPIDRIWMACHALDERTNRLFAVWCARQALALIDLPDDRLAAAIDTAERFANGLATFRDMEIARDNAAVVSGYTSINADRQASFVCTFTCSLNVREAVYTAANNAAWPAQNKYGSTTTWREVGHEQIEQLIKMIEAQL